MRIGATKILWATAVGLLVVGLAVLVWNPFSSGGGEATSADTVVADDHVDDTHDGDVADEHVDDEDAEMFMDPVGEERVIEVRTEDFRFVPDTITVKVGETIRLKLENYDPVLHDYTTDEAEFIILEASGASHGDHDVDTEAQVSLQPLHIAAEANEHGELVFEATDAGEYVFYCSVPGHVEAGMVGKVIIEE